MKWQLARRALECGGRPLIMGIVNVTPDSFSDGGRFYAIDDAVRQAAQLIDDGADIIDVGGESTRPAANRAEITPDEETRRVVPVIEALARRFTTPLSVDTTKPAVARAALNAGAEIINDISGLRIAPELADVAAATRAGLVLMHLRGTLANMHTLPPVADIWAELRAGLGWSIAEAERRGVARAALVIDPGIGFGKSQEQNITLAARPDRLAELLPGFPILLGTSRKSFIGRILDNTPPAARESGTLATLVYAALRGAHIVRVHNVKAAYDTLRVAVALRNA